jgi:hypothetical protein
MITSVKCSAVFTQGWLRCWQRFSRARLEAAARLMEETISAGQTYCLATIEKGLVTLSRRLWRARGATRVDLAYFNQSSP